MQKINASDTIAEAIQEVAKRSTEGTDGRWLEDLTARVGPHIREWDITQCFRWRDWPERKQRFPKTTLRDVGIDCVAVRGSDGKHIAIQCKSRQLNASGKGTPIIKPEIDSFTSASADDFWAERWLVINGATPIGGNAQQTISMTQKPVKVINIASDLQQQQTAFYPPPPRLIISVQTKNQTASPSRSHGPQCRKRLLPKVSAFSRNMSNRVVAACR